MSTPVSPEASTNLRIAAVHKTSLDRFLDWSSEWFSSILVKEARQALKSRQFLWTFFAMLLVVACWTVGALSYLQSNDGQNNSPGPFLLYGFWLILGFPLAIVIPFATFRSLAAEFEDGTLQLVSITTMRPYQIIAGKLGVAGLQIMVYLSVLAPCIAFTYLLRGIDIRQIWWGLMIAVTGSIALCMFGLFLASVSRSRQIGVALSVLLLFGVAMVYWIWCYVSWGLTYLFSGAFAGMEQEQGQMILLSYLGIIGTTAFLLFAAAAGRISFEADNRSSLIRIAMLVQQVVFFGWVVGILTYAFDDSAAWVISMFQTHYWLAMGAMMCSVPAVMSRRVRRSLPTSVMGRSIKSLFMPGPGRGFLFALGNIWGWNLLLIIVFLGANYLLPDVDAQWGPRSTGRTLNPNEVTTILSSVFGNCVYATTLLSIAFLFLTISYRRRPEVGPFFGLALLVVLLMVFSLIPMVVQLNWYQGTRFNYSLIQVTNWYATANELNSYGTNASLASVALFIITLAMFGFGYFALRIAGRELQYLPEAVPNRVLEEEKRRRRETRGLTEGDFLAPRKHALDD